MLISGCVHDIPLAPQERCAFSGLVLDGTSTSSGETSSAAFGRGGVSVAKGYSYGESASCRRPATPMERCEVAAFSASGRAKYDFDPGWRNGLTLVGYLAFLVPGIVMSVVFASDEDDARKSARTAFEDVAHECTKDIEIAERDKRPAEQAEEPRSAPAAESSSWWCTRYTVPGAVPTSYCARDRDDVVEHVGAARSKGYEASAPRERAGVICFYARTIAFSTTALFCYEQPPHCEIARDAAVQSGDYEQGETACALLQ